MTVLKSERGAQVGTLFVEIPMAEPRKNIGRYSFWPPVCLPGTKKGPGIQLRNPNEDPKAAQVHLEEPPGRPRRSSEEQFGVCGNLEIISFMLRKSIVLDLGDFASSG